MESVTGGAGKVARILVIDDDLRSLKAVSDTLADSGNLMLRSAISIQDALILLGQSEYDLIITEIILQDGNALNLVSEIRDHLELSCPVLILSSLIDEDFIYRNVDWKGVFHLDRQLYRSSLKLKVEKLITNQYAMG